MVKTDKDCDKMSGFVRMKNILITSVGKRVVLVGIFQQTLKELGLDAKVYTTDMKPELAPAGIRSDGCFKVTRCTSDSYVDELLDICRQKNIGIVIPTIDTELITLASNRERFESEGIALMLSDMDFVKICRDKRQTISWMEKIGIPVPKIIDKSHPMFPLFVKPYDMSRSIDTHIINSQDELSRRILEDSKLFFMELIDKREYREFTVDMYYGKDHLVKGIVPRERIEIRAGEINKGITRKNYIVGFLKERMGYLPGVRGCICIQLFYRERDHDIKGIEFNPRFGGGFPLSYYAKANFAESVIREYLLGESLSYSEEWLDNTLMLRYDSDVIIYDAKA
jgi:carbamoyl-phosphate synthase large subunit